MHINFCRAVDSYVGPFFCRILLLLKRFGGFINPGQGTDFSKTPKKIILIKFWGMGTILLASPSVRGIKKKYPSAKITLLTLSENKELCSILNSFDKRLYLDISNPVKFILGYLQILYSIRREHYDTVIDLEFITNFSAMTTLLITVFSETRQIIGFNSPVRWRNAVYFHNVSFDHSRHISMIFAKMFAILSEDLNSNETEKDQEELIQAADISVFQNNIELNESSKNFARLICVNVNAGAMSHLRRWPKENFTHIIKHLVKNVDVCVALIGSRGDLSYTQEFHQQLPRGSS